MFFMLISNLFAEHNILKFHNLVKHNELIFMHKYVNNMLPSSFNDKFVELASFERSLSFQMEVVKSHSWKQFQVKQITSPDVFKNRNKEKILSSYNFLLYCKQLLLLLELRLCDSCTFSPQLRILWLWQQMFWLKMGISFVLWPHC